MKKQQPVIIISSSRSAPSPAEQPEAVLRYFRVYAADDGHHFAGLNEVTGKGRVSTAIATWDPDTMTGTTQSGRRYSLQGPPDESGMAKAAWLAWSMRHGISDFTDVTVDYSPAARPGLN
ncbi:hypothetical protein ACVIGB_001098 [Bradyrhizobium sp. USDA 4341]